MLVVTRLDLEGAPTRVLAMADGASVAVWDGGDKRLPAVVLVHGFPENRLCWARVLAEMEAVAAGFRWVAYDLRGFGRSSATGEASWQQMVADHLEVVRQLGLARYHLVGHDWGAAVAMHVARLAPEALATASILNTTFWKMDARGMWHLWLMNLPLIPWLLFRHRTEWLFGRAMVRSFNDPSRMTAAARASYLAMFRDPATTRFWLRLYRQTLRSLVASALPRPVRRLLGSSRVRLPRPSAHAYQLPMQLIWGVDDTFCPLWVGKAIADRLRGMGTPVELHEVVDSGHFVTEEQPAAVAELVSDWLSRHSRGG